MEVDDSPFFSSTHIFGEQLNAFWMVQFEGSRVIVPNYIIFLSLKIVLVFANSADPEEMLYKADFIQVFTVYLRTLLHVFSQI